MDTLLQKIILYTLLLKKNIKTLLILLIVYMI